MCIKFVRVILFLAMTTPALGWGRDGHEVIAAIAEALLSPEGLAGALDLLKKDRPPAHNLSAIANWADGVTHSREFDWSEPLHFTNVQDNSTACAGQLATNGWGKCTFDYDRDCTDGTHPDFCNAGAVTNYTKRLSAGVKANRNDDATREALKFVVHFVGDIHQPLHCGLAKDRGGVKINVDYSVNGQGSHWNLHNVWDFGLIVNHEGIEGNTAPLIASLQAQLASSPWREKVPTWERSQDPKIWVQEALDQATRYAYRFFNGTEIRETFSREDEVMIGSGLDGYMANGGVIDLQLAQAGVRLAARLNSIWA